jgi:hypothetical protein
MWGSSEIKGTEMLNKALPNPAYHRHCLAVANRLIARAVSGQAASFVLTDARYALADIRQLVGRKALAFGDWDFSVPIR